MFRLELPYIATARPYFATMAGEPGAIWFHSGNPVRTGNRWEWFSAWPEVRYQLQANYQVRRTSAGSTSIIETPDFLGWLGQQHPYQICDSELPFTSGLAGHLNYEAGHPLHGIRSRHESNTSLASVDWYAWSVMFDHQQQKAWLSITDQASQKLRNRVLGWARSWQTRAPVCPQGEPVPSITWQPGMTRQAYGKCFKRLKDYILAGDVYQANLTRPWHATVDTAISDWALYSQLTKQIQAPYSVFHRASDHTVMSMSPERFITIEKGRITTQPIKGTRPRSDEAAEDQHLAKQLEASEKDRAENLMIVDLLRNDLSRNARVGSVDVSELCRLVTFSNVHHLVSTVTAELAEGSSPLDALRDAFPGGSITGAPKRRAMEVIDELEICARGPYCGSAFWLSDGGSFDSNILIRSIQRTGEKLTCSGGGGIVADSEVDEEYRESATKVAHILRALGQSG